MLKGQGAYLKKEKWVFLAHYPISTNERTPAVNNSSMVFQAPIIKIGLPPPTTGNSDTDVRSSNNQKKSSESVEMLNSP